MQTDDSVIVDMIAKADRVLLIEPPYKRKYPPLGLMKLSTYIKSQNKTVKFVRYAFPNKYDLICITTMFTVDLPVIRETIEGIRKFNPDTPILIGGIAASVIPKEITEGFTGITIYSGFSKLLDSCPPDYTINWEVDPKFNEFSYLFTTRGCPNKCAYCFVPKIEKGISLCPNWKHHVDRKKPYANIFDNNVTAFGIDHVKSIGKFFSQRKIKVRIDSGVDCKYINEEMAEALATIPFISPRGLRTAFDRIGEDGTFQDAVRLLLKYGISKHAIQAYVLFNFTDSPQEANYRARECVRLGITPYPQRFQPLTSLKRETVRHVSPKWTEKLCKAFQYFWLVRGLNNKHTFEEWAKGYGKNIIKLRTPDWDKWYATDREFHDTPQVERIISTDKSGLFF